MSRYAKTFERVIDRSAEKLTDIWAPAISAGTIDRSARGRCVPTDNGRALARAVAEMIETATEVALVASFLIADPAIEQAILTTAKRGVRIYVLTASENRLLKDVGIEPDFKDAIEEHKRLLNRLAGWVLVRTAPHFHAKFVVVDPGALARGLLVTCNLVTRELTRNPDLGVVLTAAEAKSLAGLFLYGFWEEAKQELRRANALEAVDPEKRVKPFAPVGGVIATSSSRQDLREAVLSLVQGARSRLIISSYGFGHPTITAAICERAAAGVKVTVLARDARLRQVPQLHELGAAGVIVRGIPWLHAKAIVADGTHGLVMTANIETLGLDEGFEVGLSLSGADATSLEQLLQAWSDTAPSRFHAEVAIGSLDGTLRRPGTERFEELRIARSHEVACEPQRANCCTRMAELEPKVLPKVEPNKIFHRLRYFWTVEPPLLNRAQLVIKARTERVPVAVTATGEAPSDPAGDTPPFDIYREPSKRLVFAIDDLAQATEAGAAMAKWKVSAVVLRAQQAEPARIDQMGGTS